MGVEELLGELLGELFLRWGRWGSFLRLLVVE
jgi:hypothetical protein